MLRRSVAIAASSLLLTAGLASCGSSSSTSTSGSKDPAGKLTWTPIADTNEETLEATSGTIDGKLYSFGGYFDKVYVARADASVYDPQTNEWSKLPDVPRAATHVALVTTDRDFILAGGNTTDANGKRVEAMRDVYDFNVDTNKWTSLPSMPASRAGGGMAKVGNTLHYFGGVDIDRREQPTHWTLDLDNLGAGWKNASPFPYPRTHFVTLAIDSSIYIMGGLKGIDSESTDFADNYRYDASTDTWTTLASLPIPLSHATDAAVVYNDRIWLFGGEKGYNLTQKESFVYDPETNMWSSNTDLPGYRFAGNAVNIDGTFYFVHGSMDSKVAWKGTLS